MNMQCLQAFFNAGQPGQTVQQYGGVQPAAEAHQQPPALIQQRLQQRQQRLRRECELMALS